MSKFKKWVNLKKQNSSLWGAKPIGVKWENSKWKLFAHSLRTKSVKKKNDLKWKWILRGGALRENFQNE